MPRQFQVPFATLRTGLIFAVMAGVAATVGGFLGRVAAGVVAEWRSGGPSSPTPEPVSVAFVVETTPDAAAEVRGLATGIRGFLEELSRAGGDARVGLIVAGGDAAPRTVSFSNDAFTADADAFRRQLEHDVDVTPGRPRIAAALEAAATLLGSAETRRCVVLVARNASADELVAAVPVLDSAAVRALSLAISPSTLDSLEELRRTFPGATLPLRDEDPDRSHFDLAVPALAAGIVTPYESWWRRLTALRAAIPAAVSAACLAGLTAIGLLTARHAFTGRRVGSGSWAGVPAAAVILGGALALAGAATPALVQSGSYATAGLAATLGAGLAWLVSGRLRWRRKTLVALASAFAVAVAMIGLSRLSPSAGWPAEMLALGVPLGFVLGAVGAPASLTMRLPGGRVVEPYAGLAFTDADLGGAGLSPASGAGPVAEIVPNPRQPGVIGLKNLSRQPWDVVSPEGRAARVAPGQTVSLRPGTRLEFNRRTRAEVA